MHPEAVAYLVTQRICVIALEMPDGSPHAATVHFMYHAASGCFVFETNRTYRKAQALLNGKSVRASIVVGVSETDRRTLQVDGVARLLSADELDLKDAYAAHFPEKQKRLSSPDTIYFLCSPTWWRYTDFTHPDGKKIYSSEDSVL